MWSGILLAVSALVVLLAWGWGPWAWRAAAAVLLAGCAASCGWAIVEGRRSERAVHQAIAQWAAARRAENRPSPDTRHTNDPKT